MSDNDRRVEIIRARTPKYTFEEIRQKFWRIHTVAKTADDYYDAHGWIPAGSTLWVSILEQIGGKDSRRFKDSSQEKETLGMPEPNASALMLDAAKKGYKRARLLDEKRRTAEVEDTDEFEVLDTIFDVLEEDMQSIIMAYAAIEAFANATVLPEDKIYIPGKSGLFEEALPYEKFMDMSLEKKLDRVLPEKLQVPPINKNGEDDTWQDYKELEDLRNAVIHMKGGGRRSNAIEKPVVIWKRIYEAGAKWKKPAYMRAFSLIKYFSRDKSEEYPNWIVNFPQT